MFKSRQEMGPSATPLGSIINSKIPKHSRNNYTQVTEEVNSTVCYNLLYYSLIIFCEKNVQSRKRISKTSRRPTSKRLLQFPSCRMKSVVHVYIKILISFIDTI